MAASAVGQVEMEVSMCLGAALVRLPCVGTRLPWVFGEVTAPVEKYFSQSAVYIKSDRATAILCEHVLALDHSDVEGSKVFGAELAGDEIG